MKLKPIGKNVIFTFLEGSTDGRFVPKHSSGIILTNKDINYNHEPKWGKVVAVGPEVGPEIVVDEYILITPLKWTAGFKVADVQLWKTDEDNVLATSDVPVFSY